MSWFKGSTALVFSTTIVFITFFCLLDSWPSSYITSQSGNLLFKSTPMSSTSSWNSSLSGFLERAEPYRLPSTEFQPPRSSLKLTVLRNTPVEPEGFTLAVFSQSDSESNDNKHYAVDTHGAIHILQPTDVEKLQNLLDAVVALPPTERFRNTWVIKHDRTSQPIDRILVPKSVLSPSPNENYEQEYNETSVQGFDYQEQRLRQPVEDIDTLPHGLWELTGAVLEGRGGGGGSEDGVVLSYVRNLLGNVF